MGAGLSTERIKQLTDMGFSVEEAQNALAATGGNVARAAELLANHRANQEREAGGPVAFRINRLLREQRPWNEFFERFLWPEHLGERVQTNLLYYRANYAIICAGVCLLSLLTQPALLLIAALCGAVVFGAIEWGDERPIPVLEQPLSLEQRLTAALLASSAIVHMSGTIGQMARIVIVCGGVTLSHAAFRARSMAARWAKFKDDATKLD